MSYQRSDTSSLPSPVPLSLSLSLCVYIYIYMIHDIYIYIYIYIYVYRYMIHVCIYIYICIHTRVYIRIHYHYCHYYHHHHIHRYHSSLRTLYFPRLPSGKYRGFSFWFQSRNMKPMKDKRACKMLPCISTGIQRLPPCQRGGADYHCCYSYYSNT